MKTFKILETLSRNLREKENTGLPESIEAARYREIHSICEQMGGWSNFKYWMKDHAAQYFESNYNLRKENEKLEKEIKKLKGKLC